MGKGVRLALARRSGQIDLYIAIRVFLASNIFLMTDVISSFVS